MQTHLYPRRIIDPEYFRILGSSAFCDGDDYEENGQHIIMFSLKELSSLKLVSCYASTHRQCRHIPQSLLEYLVKVAIKHRVYSCLRHLIALWKRETFCLELPCYYRNERLFNLFSRDGFILKQLSELPVIMIDMIIFIMTNLYLRTNSNMTIRTIDLSELRLSSGDLKRLCSAVARIAKKEMCYFCSQNHQFQNSRGSSCCCNLCDRFVIKINSIVDFHSAPSLCEEIKRFKKGKLSVEFVVKRLDIKWNASTCDEIRVLLTLVDCALIDRLTCGDFPLNNMITKVVYDSLPNFYNIKTLDISYGGFRGDRIRTLSKILSSLYCLEELYLNGIMLSNSLQALLCTMTSQCLELLNVGDCELQSADFMFLGNSHLTKTLKTLDIGCNKLQLNCMKHLLHSCKKTEITCLGKMRVGKKCYFLSTWANPI